MIARGVTILDRILNWICSGYQRGDLASTVCSAVVGVLLLLCLGAPANMAGDEHAAPLVLELKLNDMVEPILATYVDEGLSDAAQRHASLVLITMDTPGGLSDSMTDIIHHILESPVPVVVYVAPVGARGASA